MTIFLSLLVTVIYGFFSPLTPDQWGLRKIRIHVDPDHCSKVNYSYHLTPRFARGPRPQWCGSHRTGGDPTPASWGGCRWCRRAASSWPRSWPPAGCCSPPARPPAHTAPGTRGWPRLNTNKNSCKSRLNRHNRLIFKRFALRVKANRRVQNQFLKKIWQRSLKKS